MSRVSKVFLRVEITRHRQLTLLILLIRLQANDKTDPFIAVYALPTAHRIADVQHFRWTGLLAPVFVQNVLNICRYVLVWAL